MNRAEGAAAQHQTQPFSALATGGAGFIGSTVIRRLFEKDLAHVTTLDKLTYAGNLDSLAAVDDWSKHRFVQDEIADAEDVRQGFAQSPPDCLFHRRGQLHVELLGRGTTWLDTDTPETCLQASSFRQTVEERRGLKASYAEEIACRQGWIDAAGLERRSSARAKSTCGQYLRDILHDRGPAFSG